MTNDDTRKPVSPMIGVLEGGTDVASMVIFDPAAMPDDYDIRARNDPVEVIEHLAAEQSLYWLYTAADGGYNLGICLGDELPAQMASFARLLGVAARFAAPGGKLYFTGAEYAFRHDDSRLRKYPHMGACQEIAPGVYRLAVYEIDYPEDFYEALLRKRIPASAFRIYSLMDRLMPVGCLGAILLVFSILGLGWRLWSICLLPVGLALLLPAIVVARTQLYREAKREALALEREYPNYLVGLQTVSRDSAESSTAKMEISS
jgi:hypothetical protein